MAKTNVRLTAKEYREKYDGILGSLAKVDKEITKRLVDLCKLHPDVPVAQQADLDRTIIKSKSLSINYIANLTIDQRLNFITIIEKFLADQHPHQQLNLFKS